MVENIYNELVARYEMGKEALKEVANDEKLGEYDVRLLSVKIKDIGDKDEDATRLLDLRCRKNKEKDCEELVLVTGNKGAVRDVTNIEEDLKGAAEVIEIITAGLVENFPDDVLVWDWLGD